MAHCNPQVLLLSVLLTVISACKERPSMPVVVSQEEDVALPCADSNVMDPKSCLRFKLINATNASRMKVIFARPETPEFQDAERVKLKADANGQMSVTLTKSRKSDEGLYRCEIWQGWECILVKNISLRVRDCKVPAAVTAAPSTPFNLNCPVEITSKQQGPQNISWAMLIGGKPVPITSKGVVVNETALAFQSVNYSDSQWYRCEYMLRQTRRCFDIKLLVQEVEDVAVTTTAPGIPKILYILIKLQLNGVFITEICFLSSLALTTLTNTEIISEPEKEESSGAFIAVVASVIIGIAIMAALIGLFIYRRCNTPRVPQQTLSYPGGTLGGYEIVSLTLSEDRSNRVNSIYQEVPEEGPCTFRY
ncbi:uncharacterized protein LOC125893710 isoform X1 [Epinephelus fuscoguttatus]|uniref:uncharacterized protein LOC125893710 isoform X1 n=1 Tax=Epinephelus fuscoguttatus TaxID=293821 RepID=UPI0020D048D9|nr:uncharacterized protein LOC125893710 isoform X1 [Epinephelus fuscoguttatus]